MANKILNVDNNLLSVVTLYLKEREGYPHGKDLVEIVSVNITATGTVFIINVFSMYDGVRQTKPTTRTLGFDHHTGRCHFDMILAN